MALVATATKISVPASQIPTGITDPAGVNLTSSQPSYLNLPLTVVKSTTATTTNKATTFDAIRADIESQIATKLSAEMDDTANTITYNIDWKSYKNNQSYAEEMLTSNVANYVCIVDVYQNIT